MIRYERDDDGVVVLTMDDPDQSANTMNPTYVAAMTAVLDRLEAERDDITGVIVTSAKTTFFAGGDLPLMSRAGRDDAPALFEMLSTIKRDLRRLETYGRPVVAAVNGAAIGGGLEIALACHHRIALGHPLGATGAMLLGTVLDELERRDLRRAVVTLCIGGGMGVATVLERLS